MHELDLDQLASLSLTRPDEFYDAMRRHWPAILGRLRHHQVLVEKTTRLQEVVNRRPVLGPDLQQRVLDLSRAQTELLDALASPPKVEMEEVPHW